MGRNGLWFYFRHGLASGPTRNSRHRRRGRAPVARISQTHALHGDAGFPGFVRPILCRQRIYFCYALREVGLQRTTPANALRKWRIYALLYYLSKPLHRARTLGSLYVGDALAGSRPTLAHYGAAYLWRDDDGGRLCAAQHLWSTHLARLCQAPHSSSIPSGLG